MSLRVEVNPTTKEVSAPVSTDERRIYSGNEPVSAPATVKINEPAFRAKFDTETGAIVVEQNAPTSYRPAQAPAGQAGVIVRNAIGAPTTLSQAKPGDVIDFGGSRGDTTVQVALGLGWIIPSPTGGFTLPGAPGSPVDLGVNERNEKQDDQQQQEPIADASDLRGVQGTSAQSEATIKALQTHAAAQLEGIIDSIGAKGVMPDLNEVSQLLGDERAAEKVTQLHSELILAGQTVLKNIDATINPEGFETWLRKSDPDMATTIVRDMINHSAGSLAQAGRAYLKARDNALETKLTGLGIETTRIEGKLHISREAVGLPGKGDFRFISVREAEKRGLLTINEG